MPSPSMARARVTGTAGDGDTHSALFRNGTHHARWDACTRLAREEEIPGLSNPVVATTEARGRMA